MIQHFVIMGVSGCGKSSIGAAFAAVIGGLFIDGDDLHPAANVTKMASGQPLSDEDRAPWLLKVGQALQIGTGPVVIGCSALKRRYRDVIRAEADQPMMFVHLAGTKEVLLSRMAVRAGHFMPPSLLESQLAALEPPSLDEAAITVDIDQTPEAIVQEILGKIGNP